MRRWGVRAVKSTAYVRPAPHPPLPRRCLQGRQHRPFTACPRHPEKSHKHHQPLRKYAIFQRVEKPEDDVNAWIALLDGALPPHLRDWSLDTDSPALNAVDVAEVLLAAQYPWDENKSHDLLFHLGFGLDRWSAVVWLVKGLVEKFPARHLHRDDHLEANNIYKDISSLDEFSYSPQRAVLGSRSPILPQVGARSLYELSADPPVADRQLLALGHDALGQVWRTLGKMTEACAGASIKPEVLEIIAYLHHKEVMPMSIYRNEAHADRTAIQQPPLLSILSSRILTSLSDAAWRAHEKLVVEEAKANGAEYAALRPEVPGSVYRVHVAGLRPELWMELILWSCIRGGWTLAGIEVLRSLVRAGDWKPLSWREYEKTLPLAGWTTAPEWSLWEHAYRTRAPSAMDPPRRPDIDVQRTVSAEVVNAYIDAAANHLGLGVGSHGLAWEEVVQTLTELKAFIRMKNKFLDISFSSWDAVITRLLESQTIVPERDAYEAVQLHGLTTGFGSGFTAKNNKDIPAYVQDGNLAMQGLLHRALYGQIASGSLAGALQIYERIQNRADFDKSRALRNFFMNRTRKQLVQKDMFTSNFSGIEYPAFNVTLPTTILASFLDLVTDSKEFDFGRWLLYNDQADGPVISEDLYRDPFLQPAIIRFAAAAKDRKLLVKFQQRRLSRSAMQAVLDAQVEALQWDSAVHILGHLRDTPGKGWSIRNLATIVRAMLTTATSSSEVDHDNQKHFGKAFSLFREMCLGRYSRHGVVPDFYRFQVQNILSILSTIDRTWAKSCSAFSLVIGHHPLQLRANCFNIVLEGIVNVYGSAAGRRVLGIFWSHSARNAHDSPLRISRTFSGRIRISRNRPSVLQSLERQRVSIKLPDRDGNVEERVMYGAIIPNTKTILIILGKALDELRSGKVLQDSARSDVVIGEDEGGTSSHPDALLDTSPRGMVQWAVRRLAELPYVNGRVIQQLDEALAGYDMEDVREELPAMFETAAADMQLTMADVRLEAADVEQSSQDEEDFESATEPTYAN